MTTQNLLLLTIAKRNVARRQIQFRGDLRSVFTPLILFSSALLVVTDRERRLPLCAGSGIDRWQTSSALLIYRHVSGTRQHVFSSCAEKCVSRGKTVCESAKEGLVSPLNFPEARPFPGLMTDPGQWVRVFEINEQDVGEQYTIGLTMPNRRRTLEA